MVFDCFVEDDGPALRCYNESTRKTVIVKAINDKANFAMYYPVAPSELLTFHRSQGKSIDNVIICIDNLFEASMLYTGITRARSSVMFHTDKANRTAAKNKLYENKSLNEILFDAAMIDDYNQMKVMCEEVLCRNDSNKRGKSSLLGECAGSYAEGCVEGRVGVDSSNICHRDEPSNNMSDRYYETIDMFGDVVEK